MEASEPKWVNPVLNIIGVNSIRLGGLQISVSNIVIHMNLNINILEFNCEVSISIKFYATINGKIL